MKAVIIDTNGLMIPGQFGVDIFSELERLGFQEFLVPSPVVRELERIARSGKGKDRNAASIGRQLLHKCRIVETVGGGDEAVLSLALERGAAVLTNDSDLKKRLSRKGVSVVYLRQRSYLVKNKNDL